VVVLWWQTADGVCSLSYNCRRSVSSIDGHARPRHLVTESSWSTVWLAGTCWWGLLLLIALVWHLWCFWWKLRVGIFIFYSVLLMLQEPVIDDQLKVIVCHSEPELSYVWKICVTDTCSIIIWYASMLYNVQSLSITYLSNIFDLLPSVHSILLV